MSVQTLRVPVRELCKGDVLPGPHGWIALANAVDGPNGEVHLDVRYTADGGTGVRVWDNLTDNLLLAVERDVSA